MKQIKVKLTNNFHGTECYVKPNSYGELNHRQVKRAWRKLCGVLDCRCGGEAGCRPAQVEMIRQGQFGEGNLYRIIKKGR